MIENHFMENAMHITKRKIIIFSIILTSTAFCLIWQVRTYKIIMTVLNITTDMTTSCIVDQKSCSGIRPNIKYIKDTVPTLFPPFSFFITGSDKYHNLTEVLLPKAERNLINNDKEIEKGHQELAQMRAKYKDLFSSGDRDEANSKTKNDDNVNVEMQREYQNLVSPKLIYSCNGKTKLIAGEGLANYNSIYLEAKSDCGDKTFKVIDSEK